METGEDKRLNCKIIGAVLVITACGFFGFHTAIHHVEKIRLLQGMISALDYMVCELKTRAIPLPQLCRQVGERSKGKISQIFIAMSEELELQILPDAEMCMHSVLDKSSELDREISGVFEELGKQLGRFDLPGQVRGLESCQKQCALKLEQVSKNKDCRLRSYRTLGLCAGAAIAILFI